MLLSHIGEYASEYESLKWIQGMLPKLVNICKQVDNNLQTLQNCYQRSQILGACSEF